MSKRQKDSEPEVEFEAPEVEYEAPAVPAFKKPVLRAQSAVNSFDAGFCWCGKKARGCTGANTVVRHLFGKHYQFVCPFGRDKTSVDKKVFEAARKAGLVS